ELAFSPDGKSLRAVVGDRPQAQSVVRWDAAAGTETSSRPISAPKGQFDSDVSPDGRLLAMVPYNFGAARLWDLDADREAGLLAVGGRSQGRAVRFSPDGRSLAVSGSDGAIEL